MYYIILPSSRKNLRWLSNHFGTSELILLVTTLHPIMEGRRQAWGTVYYIIGVTHITQKGTTVKDLYSWINY